MKISFKYRKRLYLVCTFLEAVAVTVINRLKRKLGRQQLLGPTDVFLKLFLLHALGRKVKFRITCSERTDGAGAQAHTAISAINFARAFGHTYVHTPFVEIDHADRPMKEWVEAWENLFNLGHDEVQSDPENPREINYSTFHPRLYHAVCNVLLNIGARTVQSKKKHGIKEIFFHPFFYYSDSNPDSYNSLVPGLRRKYYCNKSPVKNHAITVAVHMRRGDVTREHPQRFTPLRTVCEATGMVKSILESHAVDHRISLYSQGKAADFVEFRQFGTEPFLDADPLWTMQQLIEADILIMSKSSFSYVAALIADGIKLYEPFWHAPLSHWIRLDRKGKFSASVFENQLRQLIKTRQTT